MVLQSVLRACGFLGHGLNGDGSRLVLVIAAESALQESSEASEEPEASAFHWFYLPSLFSTHGLWGDKRGGLCTQALLAVLQAAGRGWGAISLEQLQLRMLAALKRSGYDAKVSLRSSRAVFQDRLDIAMAPSRLARALLIGVCYKEDEEVQLEGSWNDVRDMRSWLLQQEVVKEHDLRILSDASDANLPSRSNILAHIHWLLTGSATKNQDPHRGCCGGQDVTEGSPLQLFLLFAGHGDHAELLPSDWRQAGPIREREMSEMVDDLLPSGAALTCVFDCCDSPQMLSSLLRYHIGKV